MSSEERTQQIRLLEYFEYLIDGNLGDWETELVNLEINPYSKPFNCRYYTVSRINRETFHKELKRLVKIGVLNTVHQSQCGTPVSMILMKEVTMRFIRDYYRLKYKLVRNTHPLPRIGDTIKQLVGFQYETALYLNMGYYIIRLLPASQDRTAIVTEFGKFKYNRLPMGMCASVNILQAKVNELLSNTEGIKTYIDYIPISRKDWFTKHIEQLRKIFGRLCTASLKVNAPSAVLG